MKTVLIIPISDEEEYFSGIMEEIQQGVSPGAMACIGSTTRSLPGQGCGESPPRLTRCLACRMP